MMSLTEAAPNFPLLWERKGPNALYAQALACGIGKVRVLRAATPLIVPLTSPHASAWVTPPPPPGEEEA